MKRDLGRASALLLLVGGGLGLVPACADNESSIFVQQVQLANDECTVSSDPGSSSKFRGHFDVALLPTLFPNGLNEYRAPLLIGNQLINRGDGTKLRTETSAVEIYGVDVRLEIGGASVAEFFAPSSGFVNASDGTLPGFGVTEALLIDATTAEALRSLVAPGGPFVEAVANVIVRARTLGGDEIESGEWSFPISICDTCIGSETSDCHFCSINPEAGCIANQ